MGATAGEVYTLEVCELAVVSIPVQVAPNSPPALMHMVETIPLHGGREPLASLCARVDNIRYLDQMAKTESDRLLGLFENMKQTLRRLKLQQESGISLVDGASRGRIIPGS